MTLVEELRGRAELRDQLSLLEHAVVSWVGGHEEDEGEEEAEEKEEEEAF